MEEETAAQCRQRRSRAFQHMCVAARRQQRVVTMRVMSSIAPPKRSTDHKNAFSLLACRSCCQRLHGMVVVRQAALYAGRWRRNS